VTVQKDKINAMCSWSTTVEESNWQINAFECYKTKKKCMYTECYWI